MHPLRRPSALLFDLDGTLIDSHAAIANSIRAMLSKHGFAAPTREALEAAVSFPLRTMVAKITATDDPSLVERYAESYLEHYVETMVATSNPFPGVDTMLEALAALRMPLAVLTNKTEINARRIVEGRLGASRFASFVGSVPGRPNKPDPTGAFLAADELGVPREACWIVGDSRIDIDTARAAGMTVIGVRWGITDTLATQIGDADRLLDTPDELVALVTSALG